ncbi:MAG: lamin tail domain-containing protein [Candidatus Nomurabacteria bacterium]|jgi:hypothetical protein|nr:lamin tail domain-containing protein [Candidatus Nomurabacteria bacterium]
MGAAKIILAGLTAGVFYLVGCGVAAWADEIPNGQNSETPNLPAIFVSRLSTANGTEFIELFNSSPVDTPIQNLSVRFFNSNGNAASVAGKTFQDGIFRSNNFLLIKQNGTANDSDANYTDNIFTPNGGKVELNLDNQAPQILCWLSQSAGENLTCDDDSAISFDSSRNYLSVLCSSNLICLDMNNSADHFGGWQPINPTNNDDSGGENSDNSGENSGGQTDNNDDGDDNENPPAKSANACQTLEFNELAANIDKADQFIEIYNDSATVADLDGCTVEAEHGGSAASKFTFATGDNLPAYSYRAIWPAKLENFTLTKNPDAGRTLYILDSNGNETGENLTYSDQTSGTAWAKFTGGWQATYHPTPGAENIFQKWKIAECPAGTARNEATGNCVKIPDEPAACAADEYRNPETGRCKKLVLASAASTLTACQTGYERNPATNRCRKIVSASTSTLTPCADGWERNPDTNRCRKIQAAGAAKFALAAVNDPAAKRGWMVGGGAALAVSASATLWQFKPEIARLGRRVKKLIRRRG